VDLQVVAGVDAKVHSGNASQQQASPAEVIDGNFSDNATIPEYETREICIDAFGTAVGLRPRG
jgi:hypothetical protein